MPRGRQNFIFALHCPPKFLGGRCTVLAMKRLRDLARAVGPCLAVDLVYPALVRHPRVCLSAAPWPISDHAAAVAGSLSPCGSVLLHLMWWSGRFFCVPCRDGWCVPSRGGRLFAPGTVAAAGVSLPWVGARSSVSPRRRSVSLLSG